MGIAEALVVAVLLLVAFVIVVIMVTIFVLAPAIIAIGVVVLGTVAATLRTDAATDSLAVIDFVCAVENEAHGADALARYGVAEDLVEYGGIALVQEPTHEVDAAALGRRAQGLGGTGAADRLVDDPLDERAVAALGRGAQAVDVDAPRVDAVPIAQAIERAHARENLGRESGKVQAAALLGREDAKAARGENGRGVVARSEPRDDGGDDFGRQRGHVDALVTSCLVYGLGFWRWGHDRARETTAEAKTTAMKMGEKKINLEKRCLDREEWHNAHKHSAAIFSGVDRLAAANANQRNIKNHRYNSDQSICLFYRVRLCIVAANK